MSEKDIQTHKLLVSQTGLHKFTREQLDVMEKIGGLDLTYEGEVIEDPECTMNLPQLGRRDNE